MDYLIHTLKVCYDNFIDFAVLKVRFMPDLSKRREIEKRMMHIAKEHPWSKESFEWLRRENMYEFAQYGIENSNLLGYFGQQHLSSPDYDVTVISVDILQDTLYRRALLKELLEDKTLKDREDIKKIMLEWHLTYKSVYHIFSAHFLAIDHFLTTLIEIGLRSLKKLETDE